MIKITSTELQRKGGEILLRIQREGAATVTSYGRDRAVLVSWEEYQRLIKRSTKKDEK